MKCGSLLFVFVNFTMRGEEGKGRKGEGKITDAGMS